MKPTTLLLIAILAVVTCLANEYQDFQMRINDNPELKDVFIELLAKTGGPLLSDKIDIRGSLVDVFQRQSRTFGIELSLVDIIKVALLSFKKGPVPSDVTPRKYFASNGDASVVTTLLRGVKKILAGEQRYSTDKSLIVQTTDGKLRGVRLDEYGVKFIGYFNIPYAIVHRRFQAPRPPKPWKGIRSAERELTFCPQKLRLLDFIAGAEDCLQLNVVVPAKRIKKTPVFVWIHGGAFRVGIANTYITHPEKLLKQGLIVVSIHYRLGALGFLSTGTKDAPGNAGLKDIVAALKWIKDNIANFGGDPDNVTLYGVSSGGIAIEYLTVSPMARGLFAKAIIAGASIFNDWSYTTDPLKQAYRLGRSMGFNGTHVKDLVRFLENVNPLVIVEEQYKLFERNNPSGEFFPFVPCTEENIPGVEPFLNDYPEQLIKSGNYYQVPTIYSFNDQEGLALIRLKSDPKHVDSIERNLEYYLPTDLLAGLNNPLHRKDIVNKIRQFYFNGEVINKQKLQSLVDFLGDSKFLQGFFKSIRLRFETTGAPTFVCEFAFDGELSTFKYNNDIEVSGVPHAEELGYIFRLSPEELIGQNNITTQLVSKRYVTMFSNFAKYGHPVPKASQLLPVHWYPVESTETLDYLEITDGLRMMQNPFKERRQFWSYIYRYKKYLLQMENTNNY